MLKIKYKLLTILCLSSLANSEMIQIEWKSGVVLDTKTKQFWQDNEDVKTVKKNWYEAIDYCENLSLAGFDDWKLPDRDTLKALYPKKDALQNVAYDPYWTSTTDTRNTNYAWIVYLDSGNDSWSRDKASSIFVRCVRAGQSSDPLIFSSFLHSLKTSNQTEKSIVLTSSSISESTLLWVKKDGKNYFGTKDELKKQFGLSNGYSKTPFETIQQLTQKGLNQYLTIATIQQPTLPQPLNLIKDEFESKAEFSERIKNETAKREAEIQRLQDEFRRDVEKRNSELEKRKTNIEAKKKEFLFENFALVMGSPKLSNSTFDAETNTMFVDVIMENAEWNKQLAIPMKNREEAKKFKEQIDDIKTKLEFELEDDSFVLKSATLELGWFSKFSANLTNSTFTPEKVAVTIENKKVAFNELQNPNLVDKYQVQALGYGESNQAKGLKYNDDLTPIVKKLKATPTDPTKWLFAVAIEKYDEADAVSFAKNSANAFIEAAQKRFGISERNTYALIDEKATSSSIKDRLELMLKNVKEGDSVYFYYSGHGIPNPSEDGEPYILPKDKIVDFVTRDKEFMVRNIYKQLSDSKASKVVAFMDSCFSGNTDGVSNIKGVAATVMKAKKAEFDKSKMVVLTAGTNNQFSNAYFEKGHRLFSYYLTKAIAERPTIDIDSIYKDVAVKVKDESYKMGDLKVQEPQIEGNSKLGI